MNASPPSSAPDTAQYHLRELAIARDASAPGHLMPTIPRDARAVLDIGCGAGQTLIGSDLAEGTLACGIDPDVKALALGRGLAKEIEFAAAAGEALPYAARTFDVVFSRVALPYTNIPVALAEMARVLKPGGSVWLSLHPPKFAFRTMARAVRARSVRATVYPMYTLLNGLLLHAVGRQIQWPFGHKRYESVQTSGGIKRALERAGFTDVHVTVGKFFVVTGRLL